MRRPAAAFAIAGMILAGGAQTSAPPRFALEIPGLEEAAALGDVIELPVARLDSLTIHILEPLASKVSYARIFPRLNSQGASVISQFRTSVRGKSVVLNLNMRDDITLEPGVNTLEILVQDANGRRYYRNWILRLREQARNDWFAYEFTRGKGPGGSVPPEIEIVEPTGPVRGDRVHVRGSVTAQNALAFLSVGGQPAPVQNSSTSAEFNVTLRLEAGQRNVVVEAADIAGSKTKVVIPVANSDAVRFASSTGDRMAILIGLSRFLHAGSLPCTPGAQAAEVSSLAEVLKSAAKLKPDRLAVLTDESATLARIRNVIRNFGSQARPDDLVFLYYGGCGIQDETNPDRYSLAAYDTQGNLPETALDTAELEQVLNDYVPSRNVVLVFDVAGSHRALGGGRGTNLIAGRLLRLSSAERGRTVLVSPPPIAADSKPGAGENFFVKALAGALSGKADYDSDSLVTTTELANYLATQVRTDSGGTRLVMTRKSGELPMFLFPAR